ncbi:hypothetical protein [Nevskia ramosa]|uniref:hypothetical protein n=1 Tax=Nevskia ramosa TaxID=64002 RepID=UPI003D0F21B4
MGRSRLLLSVLAVLIIVLLAQWWRGQDQVPETAPDAMISESPPVTVEALPAPSAASSVARQTVERAVVDSGITIRLIRRARLAPPPGRLADGYAKLLPEAQSGNRLSQYRLGSLLFECREVPADSAALEQEVEAFYQTRRHGRWTVDAPKAEEATLRHLYAECDGIPAEARVGFRDWIKQAADAGIIEAQLNLPLKLPPDDYCQFLAECAADQRARQEALQAEAIDYTTRAREAGSVAALWTFAAWYAGGEVLPQNDIEAYAHFRALDQVNAASQQPQRFGKLLAGMKKKLRAVDIDAGETRARELLSNPNCCVITP